MELNLEQMSCILCKNIKIPMCIHQKIQHFHFTTVRNPIVNDNPTTLKLNIIYNLHLVCF